MKKISEPILFFGSGPVAAESLRLLAADFTIEAVVTKPRPPHHHGSVPVLDVAKQLILPIYEAVSKEKLDELFASKKFKSRAGVLIDFGIIVSQGVIDYFPLGIVNSHFSILPEWRGADPITFSILSGQAQTGVSLMLLVEAMDEGPLLGYGEYDLSHRITSPQLTAHLIQLSSTLLRTRLPLYLTGKVKAVPQSITKKQLSYSRKLTKEDGIIDWQKSAVVLEREIRAYIEWPKSRAFLGSKEVVITEAGVANISGEPGKMTTVDKKPVVYCGESALVIKRLKPIGKQEMTGEAFLAGYGALL